MRGATVEPVRGDGTERAQEDISDLLITVTTIEGRVLRLVREGDREIPVEDLANELTLLSRDLRRCYRRAQDLSERRDLGFRTQRKLRHLQQQCIWLYRKAHQERAFFQKLQLEARLRRVISEEAFGLYQQLLWADHEERRLAASEDSAVAALLLAEPAEPSPT
ncbi:MAG TPA: hypothetical protein VGZ23_13385 [bacterium]|nr:hypothetical protein [bacterium]